MSTEQQNSDPGHSSKKRGASGQLTKDSPGVDDDGPEPEMGTFQRASDEVLAARRIVKVRRKQPPSSSAEPSSTNPFAQISLSVQPPPPDEKKTEEPETNPAEQNGRLDIKATSPAEEKSEKKDLDKDASENGEPVARPSPDEPAPAVEKTAFSSFQQLSSTQNAFSGLAKVGTGFSGSPFSGSVFGLAGGAMQATVASSLFGATSAGSTAAALPVVPVETGEENEQPVFAGDAILFEFIDGGWKERGKGEVKVNVSDSPDTNKSRLVMRARGNLRLILNASLYPDMSLTAMEKRGVTFRCINSAGAAVEGKAVGLATFALKFKDPSILEDFRMAVEENKGEKRAEEES